MNKIPPNFDTLFVATIVAIWLFKGLTARPLYRLFGVKGLIQCVTQSASSCAWPPGTLPPSVSYDTILTERVATIQSQSADVRLHHQECCTGGATHLPRIT